MVVTPSAADVTARVADFVAGGEPGTIPDEVKRRAIHSFADTVAVAIAGATSEPARAVLAALDRAGGLGSARHRLWGTALHASATDACMFNGVAAHALEYDDTIHPGPLHPSCALVPAAVAAGEIVSASGVRVLTGYLLGLEIAARLSRALNPRHYRLGWHATGTVGALAATAAAAHVLGLDSYRTADAIGVAASLASGARRNTGSMTKPLHAGNAARCGLTAALGAEAGLTSVPGALTGELGFLSLYGAADGSEDVFSDLGSGRWELSGDLAHGLKIYPCCGEATAIIEALLACSAPADEVDMIIITTGERAKRILRYPEPVDLDQARFSAQCLAALAIVEGEISLRTLTSERVFTAHVQSLMRRITHRVNDEGPELGDYGARVEVVLRDGSVRSRQVLDPLGWGTRRLSDVDREAKVVQCTAGRMDETAARRLVRSLDAIEDAGSIAELLAGV